MNKAPLILFILLLAGCQSTLDKVGYVKKDKITEQIEFIKTENAKELDKKEREIKSALGEVISGKNSQLQKASNSLYGATLTKPYFKDESRPLIVVFNRIDEAKAALGVGPTIEAMKNEQERLIKELDETLTSLDDLKKSHDKVVEENSLLVAATKEKEELVKQKEAEKLAIERAGLEKLMGKQNELNKLNDKLLAQEKLNGEDKKYIESNKRLLMISLGICSLAGLLVAIYLPLFRKEAGYFSGITGAAAITIPFIQSWHINAALLLGLAYIAFLLIRKHSISHKTNENLVNAVQEIKDLKPDLYKNEVKPLLEEWNKKYLKDGSKVEDKAVITHVDEILRDYEKK